MFAGFSFPLAGKGLLGTISGLGGAGFGGRLGHFTRLLRAAGNLGGMGYIARQSIFDPLSCRHEI